MPGGRRPTIVGAPLRPVGHIRGQGTKLRQHEDGGGQGAQGQGACRQRAVSPATRPAVRCALSCCATTIAWWSTTRWPQAPWRRRRPLSGFAATCPTLSPFYVGLGLDASHLEPMMLMATVADLKATRDRQRAMSLTITPPPVRRIGLVCASRRRRSRNDIGAPEILRNVVARRSGSDPTGTIPAGVQCLVHFGAPKGSL